MAKLIADLHEYKMGYRKNYDSYRYLYKKNAHIKARRMLLAYGTECGLKYLVLKKWNILNYRDIELVVSDNSSPRHEIINTHNLEKLIRELGQAGMFRFPTKLKTSREIVINAENFHQYCRYAINPAKKMQNFEEEFDNVLRDIAAWIDQCMEMEGVK